MKSENITISLQRFLLIEQCPASWKGFDLYLLRDEEVLFYVNQPRRDTLTGTRKSLAQYLEALRADNRVRFNGLSRTEAGL